MTRSLTPPSFSVRRRRFWACWRRALLGAAPARAQQVCQTLRYTFQPDCLQSAAHPGTCRGRPLPARPDRSDQGQQERRSPRPRPADRRLDRERRRHDVRRHADGDQPGRGARHRQSPRSLELRLQPEVPLRQAADGAADLGPCARQALSHGGLPGRRHQRRHATPAAARGAIGFHENCSSPEPFYCRPLHADRVRRRDHLSRRRCSTARRGTST